MGSRRETAGLIGMGFLFAFIALFLLVSSLRATGHAELAAELGLSGDVILAAFTGRFLLHRWRTASCDANFHNDGDVQFALAVFLLVLLVPAVVASASRPVLVMLLPAAAIPARTFVRSLRRHR